MFLIGFGTLLAILVFSIIEVALSWMGIATPDSYADPFVGFEAGQNLFERQTDEFGATVYVTKKHKLRFFNEQRFPDPKPSDTYRIITLGGSTTYGRPYDHHTSFSNWLALLLRETDSSRNFEVINAGGVSYASYRIVVLMQELIRYEPDLFVVYTGHNEFLEERTYGDIIDESSLRRFLRKRFHRLRTVTLLRNMLTPDTSEVEVRGSRLEAEVKAKLDVWSGLESFTRDDELRRATLKHFRFNLQQMIDIAGDHNVDILFINPASNIKDFSPFKSEHLPEVIDQRLRTFESYYQKGMKIIDVDAQGALTSFEKALRLSDQFAEVHYRMGRCHFVLDDLDEAKLSFLTAKDFDICPLRALDEINISVLETSHRNGVPVIDFPALLQQDSLTRYGHDILGHEYFLDHVHPRIEIHQRLAEWILAAMAKEGFIPVEEPLSAAQRQTLYDGFLDTLEPAYYAQRDLNLGKVLGWAGKNEEAAEAFERASRMMPDDPMVHHNLGIVYQKLGKAKLAVEEYETVTRLTPDFVEAHFNLGKSLQMMGDFRAAALAFQKALELEPGDAKAHYNLALCYRELGRFQEELKELERARALESELPEITSLLASVYIREGNNYGKKGMFDEAIGVFEKALELETDSGKVHYHLASIYAARGQTGPALQHFREAKALGIDVPEKVIRELESQ